mmetsp:Transcript_24001/g.62333  ORF Transcript_24001/g.62333 Transcript_24001/m.62333 type:complete len:290 (+) Transcript_24001:1368-2237(+)
MEGQGAAAHQAVERRARQAADAGGAGARLRQLAQPAGGPCSGKAAEGPGCGGGGQPSAGRRSGGPPARDAGRAGVAQAARLGPERRAALRAGRQGALRPRAAPCGPGGGGGARVQRAAQHRRRRAADRGPGGQRQEQHRDRQRGHRLPRPPRDDGEHVQHDPRSAGQARGRQARPKARLKARPCRNRPGAASSPHPGPGPRRSTRARPGPGCGAGSSAGSYSGCSCGGGGGGCHRVERFGLAAWRRQLGCWLEGARSSPWGRLLSTSRRRACGRGASPTPPLPLHPTEY